MSKVTSKLQLTVPKALAAVLGIEPGDDVEWIQQDGGLRIVPVRRKRAPGDARARLKLFDAATRRVAALPPVPPSGGDRGWSREELYDRGRPR